MKRYLITGTVLLALLAPGLLMAQSDLTLESLAAEIEGLTSKVTDLFASRDDLAQRLAAVETAIAPTPTPSPTSTPLPTLTPTATPVPADAIATLSRGLNVRRGPGTHHAVLDTADAGDEFRITGRNLAGDWWQIDYDGEPAWVYAPYVTASQAGDVQIVATPTPIPTATSMPTDTPAPTATASAQDEAQQETARTARLLALNDYEGFGGTVRPWGSFSRLPEAERERRIAYYVPLFTAAMEKCGLDDNRMFWVVNSSANKLDTAGVTQKLGMSPRAFWLEWLVANEIPEPENEMFAKMACEFAIQDLTASLLEEYGE